MPERSMLVLDMEYELVRKEGIDVELWQTAFDRKKIEVRSRSPITVPIT